MKYIFSFLTLLVALGSYGQVDALRDSTSKSSSPVRLNAISPSFNLARFAQTAFGSPRQSHEAQLVLSFDAFDFAIDIGVSKYAFQEEFAYESRGRYLRIGVDKNLIGKNNEENNTLSFGLRYARAFFGDKISDVKNYGFGGSQLVLENTSITARWIELNLNLRVKIISRLYTGFTLRWKILRKVKNEGILQPYYVTGFGKTSRENATAFDYYLAWRISFKSHGD